MKVPFNSKNIAVANNTFDNTSYSFSTESSGLNEDYGRLPK